MNLGRPFEPASRFADAHPLVAMCVCALSAAAMATGAMIVPTVGLPDAVGLALAMAAVLTTIFGFDAVESRRDI